MRREHLPAVVQGNVAGHGQGSRSARPIVVLQEVPLGPPRPGVCRVHSALVDGGCQLVGEGEGVVRHARRFGQRRQHQGWKKRMSSNPIERQGEAGKATIT